MMKRNYYPLPEDIIISKSGEGRCRLIEGKDGGEKLNDHLSGPNEWMNMAGDPAFASDCETEQGKAPSPAGRASGGFRRMIGPVVLFRRICLLSLLTLMKSAPAAEIDEFIATKVNGFDIPIVVVTPDEGEGPFPVVYHVHGGGWNGGTDTMVPEASVPSGFRFLTDHLGVIHVGLAYRCKLQGTFPDAMEDLRASVKWFEERAGKFNADLSRVGLSGGSAGTPLSSLLAQEIAASKTYVGFYGVYDLLNNEASLFPNEEARTQFGLIEEREKRAASSAHNLRENPPASLLFHGGRDILTHPTQSLRFADALRVRGAFAEAIIFPEVNHGFFSERYPDEFQQTLLRVAQLYVDHLGVEEKRLAGLEEKIERRVDGYRRSENIDVIALLGTWSDRNESWTFTDLSSGFWVGRKSASGTFSYRVVDDQVMILKDEIETALYMQRDGRALFEIVENDERRSGQRFHYRKGK